MIRIGPSGIGGAKEAAHFIKEYHENGLTAAEIAFTYGVYLKKNDALAIADIAKKDNVDLSIHASYFVNLNTIEKKKLEASRQRILACCERGHELGVKYIVFHAAFYGESKPAECYETVKKEIIDLNKTIKDNNWHVVLAPETTGKGSQFGTLDELTRLAKETGCHFCIDFAHIKARNNGVIDYDDIMKKLKEFKHIHAHFSGIEYTAKGEKKHLLLKESEVIELLGYIKKYKIDDITIINESPEPFEDAVKLEKIKHSLGL